ncbi:MAG TPA: amino acid permease [Leadbetterella sp.]|nr:amino acid permease [Leadbetterella sp.]
MASGSFETKQKKIGAFSIWAIGVGLVISGESFGWNLGWAITGPIGFFVPVLVTAVLYYALVLSLIELACVYPKVDGPHIYIKNAFGKKWAEIISVLILFEFLFVNPAIATSIGEYLGFLTDHLEKTNWIATGFIAFFCLVSLFNFNLGVQVIITLTLLAIFELLIFSGAIVSEFSFSNLYQNKQFGELTFESFVRAMPFAIWMFLAIEGISIVSKNTEQEKLRKTLGIGYKSAFWTLAILATMVLLLAAGGINLNPENWEIISKDNHPMPATLALILGKNNTITQIFTFLGLFGLIASLQGIAFTTTFQIEYFLKKNLPESKFNRAIAATSVFVASLFAIWGSTTSVLIELSVFGAVCMYFGVSYSLIVLRKKKKENPKTVLEGENDESLNKHHHIDFKSIIHKVFPYLALILSVFCMLILAYLHPIIVGTIVVLIIIYLIFS